MGEYHLNGHGGRRQPDVAEQLFCNAAVKGDSQVSQNLNIIYSFTHIHMFVTMLLLFV